MEVIIKEKRDRVADELLRTEQSYVRSLNIIVHVYKHPMIDGIINKELPVTEEQLRIVFGNLEELINVNTTLLQGLVDRMKEWSPTQQIGDVLAQLAPFLKLYSLYSLNYEKASTEVEELKKKAAFKLWLDKKSEDPIIAGLDFGAYLIMPIQRIPRYRLLIQELLSATPEDHPDYKELSEALNKLKSVADDVNVAIVEQENRDRMLRIAKKFQDYKELEIVKPGRRFVRDGELFKVCRRERKKRHFFLFSDILVYSFPTEKNGKFKISRQLDLLLLSVKDIEDAAQKNLTNAFQIGSESKSFVVIAQSAEDKQHWVQCLAESISHRKEAFKTLDLKNVDADMSAAPVWVPDDEVKACTFCSTKFTVITRRHHCRQCGQIACGNCSNNKRFLKGQGKVRVCGECIKKPADWTPQGRTNLEGIGDSSSSESNVEVLFELEALYPYNPDAAASLKSQKLPFEVGDIISILQVDDSGWWLGELNGQRGWVPAGYLEKPP